MTLRATLWLALVHGVLGSLPGDCAAAAAGSSLHFLVIGDQGGTANADWQFTSKAQVAVAAQMAAVARSLPIRFVVGTGDNMYWDGVQNVDDPRFNSSFEMVYHQSELDVPFYLTLGNHDYTGPDPTQRNVSAQLLYTGRGTGRWTLPARYYSRVVGVEPTATMQIWVLDSCALVGALENKCAHDNLQVFTDPTHLCEGVDIDKVQLNWLENSLAQSTAAWKVVVNHFPVYSSGYYGSYGCMLQYLQPILESHGVALYLNGHFHNSEHFVKRGVHYLTVGASSEIYMGNDTTSPECAAADKCVPAHIRAARPDALFTWPTVQWLQEQGVYQFGGETWDYGSFASLLVSNDEEANVRFYSDTGALLYQANLSRKL